MTDLRCNKCAYFTQHVEEAVHHAETTGHSLSGTGPDFDGEPTTMTISVDWHECSPADGRPPAETTN